MEPTCYNRHFSLKQLSPFHDDPTLFIVSQWQPDKSQPNTLYILYRALLVGFLVTTWYYSFFYFPPWGTKLTNWGYTLCMLQNFFVYVLVLCFVYVKKYGDISNIPKMRALKLHSLYWIMNSAATSIGFMITIIFWSVLYRDNMDFSAVNFFVHGSNSIVLLIDLCIVGHPVRILHCIYPVIFGLAYLIFTVGYHFYDTNRGGPGYIYKMLDWHKPGSTILVVLAILVLVIVLHLFTFVVYTLKLKVHDKIHNGGAWSGKNQTQSTERLGIV